MNKNNKNYPLQKLIGAMFPEHYQHELVDKLKAEFGTGAQMSHLVRALLARWFHGEIKVSKSQMRTYSLDNRKRHKFLPRGAKLSRERQLEGYEAAGKSLPRIANPYSTDNGLKESLAHEAWDRGWASWFTKTT